MSVGHVKIWIHHQHEMKITIKCLNVPFIWCRSKPGRRADRSAAASTTNCCALRKSSAPRPSSPGKTSAIPPPPPPLPLRLLRGREPPELNRSFLTMKKSLLYSRPSTWQTCSAIVKIHTGAHCPHWRMRTWSTLFSEWFCLLRLQNAVGTDQSR